MGWYWSGSNLGKLYKSLSTQKIRSKQAVRMRNSCFQARWYFKRHSQHVSCCLPFHFTPCCQTLSFILRKQMEKGRLSSACSHPGSRQGPPTTMEVQRLTVRAAKDSSAPMQKITSSCEAVHHTLKEETSILPARASKLGLGKQKQVLDSSNPAHGSLNRLMLCLPCARFLNYVFCPDSEPWYHLAWLSSPERLVSLLTDTSGPS